MLSSNEWDLLKKLILILGPFEEATRYLGGEKYITYSTMNPIIEQIKKLLLLSSNSPSSSTPTLPISPISPTSSTLPIPSFNTSEIYQEIENADDVFIVIEEVEILESNVKKNNQKNQKIDLNKPLETKDILDKVKKDLYNAMCFYWKFSSNDQLLSTILDPRIKFMSDKVKEEEILYQQYEEYKENYLQTPIESRASSPTPSEISISLNTIYQPKLFSIFEQSQPKATNEVEEYLKEDKIPFNHCPFNWWLNKKNKYPILAKMARIYLAIPATSTSSERLFSDAGNLLSAKRSRINSELFKRIMFLKRNATKVNSIHE